ncbi:glutathione gamma-glutamylcysteinyltransferase 1-like [Lytechinus variegatus]|uniref:glutathione gamma-glutamylcysteinyltransferase 1-like n=1 Tax=Lytechinus variegatus TaxID=7654 RepID=UPI001BB0F1F9|nr:glutathione gamma-glutamylcysteinyltransferase 1-like [Lytechinus variegatus]
MGNALTYIRDWWSPGKVPLKSPEGEGLLEDAAFRQTLLIRIFSFQEKMGYCGIQSAALLMSARCFGIKFPNPANHSTCDVTEVPYRDTNMFSFKQTTNIVNCEEVLKRGATLYEIQCLLQAHGVPTTKFYAKDIDVDTFRSRAIQALSHSDSLQGVMVNYLYPQIFTTDSGPFQVGHFSPLAAYHRDTDRFLLLDVWYEGQSEWIKTSELFNLMNTVDPDGKVTRGFLISGLDENENEN